MRTLTFLAVAVLAAGIYHYRSRQRAGIAPGGAELSDQQLEERVRAGISGAASRPVEVRVTNGVVSLRGIVSRAERDVVLASALAVPGVSQVTNYLETEEPTGELGAMQSGLATGI